MLSYQNWNLTFLKAFSPFAVALHTVVRYILELSGLNDCEMEEVQNYQDSSAGCPATLNTGQ